MSKTTSRHVVGAGAALAVFVVQSPVVYAGLLAYAWQTDGDPGGPLALLSICCSLVCLGVALVPLLFVPAGWVGERSAKSGRLFTKMLVSLAVAGALAMSYVALIAVLADGPTVVDILWLCLCGAGAVLAPTAAYVGVAHLKGRKPETSAA